MSDAAFWDRIAPKYAKSPISNPTAYEDSLARVRSHLSPKTRVLELGCGTGATALKLVDTTGPYVATDISPGMIAQAHQRLADHTGPNPEFRVAGVDAALSGAEYDAILALNLLHLLPDLDASLAAIHKALANDGLFISKTPALGERWYYRPMIAAMRLVGRAPFVTTPTIAELDQRIAAAGFRIVETGLIPPTTPSRFIVARRV